MDLLTYFRLRNKMTLEEWENSFEKREQEIIVLIHEGGGGSKRNGFWDVAQYFLAYVDYETGLLHKKEGRIVYAYSNKDYDSGISQWKLDDESIYRLKVRAKTPEQIPDGITLSSQNQFLLVEIIEKNPLYPELEEILAEYKKPVLLQDDSLGELIYNKKINSFEGNTFWRNKKIDISLDVNKNNKSGITKARKALKTLLSEQIKWDNDIRNFAAKKLINLACEWKEANDETPPITEENFAQRIKMMSISMTSGGSFTIYFNDDDIFFGHYVTVCGSLRKGIVSADIVG